MFAVARRHRGRRERQIGGGGRFIFAARREKSEVRFLYARTSQRTTTMTTIATPINHSARRLHSIVRTA